MHTIQVAIIRAPLADRTVPARSLRLTPPPAAPKHSSAMHRRASPLLAFFCALQLIAGLAFAPAEMPGADMSGHTAHSHRAAAMSAAAMAQMEATPPSAGQPSEQSAEQPAPHRAPCHSQCCFHCTGCSSAVPLDPSAHVAGDVAIAEGMVAPAGASSVRVTHLATTRLPYPLGPPLLVRV
jgi:hypothetical protein